MNSEMLKKPKMRVLFAIALLTIVASSFSQVTEECKCVIYYLCNQTTATIIDDGNGLIVERIGECDCMCGPREVCCRLKTNITAPSKTVGCGVHNPDGVGYKISTSGDDVLFGEFPWVVDILTESGAFRCGGSLIHPSVVLTAAHCVTRKKTYIARAGDWDSSVTSELFKHQDLRVSSIKIHEDYNPAVQHNDIALLFLSGSFNLTSHIQHVCLSDSETAVNRSRCYVIGRGKDSQGQYRPILKNIHLPLVDKDACQTTLRQEQSRLGRHFNLHSSALCAGGEKDKDACAGDGGGPLVCGVNEEDRFQQMGIVSWGLGCNKEIPAVYTNVPVLRKWIDKQMQENNLETKQYIYT